MSWNHRYPLLSEYDSYEEYEAACEAYKRAEDDYVEEYLERVREGYAD